MSGQEQLEQVLNKLGRGDKINSVLKSPQTEITNDKLVSLDVSDLGITELSADVFEGLGDLERFHAGFNFIVELPESLFSPVKNLKFINFYGNTIARLPDNIFDGMGKLEWLDLRSNELESLPKSIGGLSGLKYLFLQNNPLSDHADYNWASDYHSKRDVNKFMPEFQEAMGLKVTAKKPKTREQIAEEELKKRQAAEKKE